MSLTEVGANFRNTRRSLLRRELESDEWKFLGVKDIRTKSEGKNPTLTELAREYNELYPEVQLKQYGLEAEIYVRGESLVRGIGMSDPTPRLGYD